jgi:hypothetical protein
MPHILSGVQQPFNVTGPEENFGQLDVAAGGTSMQDVPDLYPHLLSNAALQHAWEPAGAVHVVFPHGTPASGSTELLPPALALALFPPVPPVSGVFESLLPQAPTSAVVAISVRVKPSKRVRISSSFGRNFDVTGDDFPSVATCFFSARGTPRTSSAYHVSSAFRSSKSHE